MTGTGTLYRGVVGFPEAMLDEGEEVVVDVRPHWRFLAGPVAVLLLVIAGALAALALSAPTWVGWIVVVALALACLRFGVRYVRWATTNFVVTTTRLVTRSGVFSRRGREIPLDALTDIGYEQNLFERVIRCGDIVLESAGREGHEVFADLPRPAAIQRDIYHQLDQLRHRGLAPAAPVRESVFEQIDGLARLLDRGIITEAEFEARKSQLLDRL
jgi:uncharacterized membrane protein YdbT with pleckstrin-like domain